jgi:hypothetical protein
MFLLDWIREWKEIRNEYPKPEKVCESCETLKMQLAIANNEKAALLNRLLEKPEPEQRPDTSNLKAVLPTRHQNWNVRRQLLEREDRERAKILNRQKQESVAEPIKVTSVAVNASPAEPMSVEDIEKELDISSNA